MGLSRAGVTGIGLGFLAGYVDTLGFMALFGLFTAHITGNFVLIAVALTDTSQESLQLKLLAFPAFVMGIAATRLIVVLGQARHWPALSLALGLQILLMGGFMLCGLLATPIGRTVTPLAVLAGLLGTAAMGAHSATSRLLLAHLAPTSMMTGNVTQLVIDTVDLLRGAGDSASVERISKLFWPLCAFALGCTSAAFAYLGVGFWAMALPIAILLAEVRRADATCA